MVLFIKLIPNQNLKVYFLSFFLLNFSTSAWSFSVIFTNELLTAQKNIIELKLNLAEQLIRIEKIKYPENLACDYLLEYVSFYKVLTSQNQVYFQQYKQLNIYNNNRYAKLLDANPYKKYFLAQAALHEAFANVIFEEYLKAIWQFKSSHKYLVQNNKLFPDFNLNKKNIAIIEAMTGTMPDNYKWITNIAGMQSSFTNGLEMLLSFIKHAEKNKLQPIDINEAKMAYAILQVMFAEEKDLVLSFCNANFTDCKTNLSHVFINAFVGLECKKPKITFSCIDNFKRTADYAEFYFIDYMYARSKMYLGHSDSELWYKKYVTFFNEKTLRKDAYRKLSWLALLKNDTTLFKIYHRQAIKNHKGEEDMHIQEMLGLNKLPDKRILQARIFFDGGNYIEALNIFESLDYKQILNKYELVEYFYRWGRTNYENETYIEAIEAFEKAVNVGLENNTYMLPYAEFYTAQSYVKLNKIDLAKLHFKKALSYSGYQYEATLKQKVKAAVSKLEK